MEAVPVPTSRTEPSQSSTHRWHWSVSGRAELLELSTSLGLVLVHSHSSHSLPGGESTQNLLSIAPLTSNL